MLNYLLAAIVPVVLNAVFFVWLYLSTKNIGKEAAEKIAKQIADQPPPKIELPAISVDAEVDTTEIRRDLEEMKKAIPEFVLQSLMGTANTQKGKLGEIIGYLSLKAEYDRIVPLGTIVDFLAIKFPSDESPGCIDLIDIKTGKSARLSPDQRKLRDLVRDGQINFKTIKIDNLDGLRDEHDND
jgi:predicted Holliday junction resolvase-like endonuclease